jgi:hypothetical protein
VRKWTCWCEGNWLHVYMGQICGKLRHKGKGELDTCLSNNKIQQAYKEAFAPHLLTTEVSVRKREKRRKKGEKEKKGRKGKKKKKKKEERKCTQRQVRGYKFKKKNPNRFY